MNLIVHTIFLRLFYQLEKRRGNVSYGKSISFPYEKWLEIRIITYI